MPDQLPPSTFLRSLAKWMLQHGIGSQTDHERLVEIGDSLEWLPIESAPKDGVEVLLWCDYGKGDFGIEKGVWDCGWWGEQLGYEPDGVCEELKPLKWRPLPTPPAKEG